MSASRKEEGICEERGRERGGGGMLGLEQGIDGIDGKVTRNVKAHNTGKWVN